MSTVSLVLVGVGEDGWDGLSAEAKSCVEQADVLVGGRRHLNFVPDVPRQQRIAWRSDIAAHIQDIIKANSGKIVMLASGDPMFYGVGALLTRYKPRIIPALSSTSLAAARLGWALHEVEIVSVCGRPFEALHAELYDGVRVFVLSAGAETPERVADTLMRRGFGASEMHVLERLGGPRERIVSARADALPQGPYASLNIVALNLRAAPDAVLYSPSPGLPDESYETDGQLTKREVRAITLARLAPRPGELLWDVGAGSGSISIEWLRAARRASAIAVEAHPERAARIRRNGARLGTPGLAIVQGRAPEALDGLPPPDAVFLGGGLGDDVFAPAFEALKPGGRLVANAVTLESERMLLELSRRHGGDLIRIEISRAASLGTMRTFRPLLPVTQWALTKS